MDYTGLTGFGKVDYPINRPLTEDEKKNRLYIKKPASDKPLDWLSVIKVNSTYLELVDRWYPVKGSYAWVGVIWSAIFVLFILYYIEGAISQSDWKSWAFTLVASLFFMLFTFAGYAFMKLDMFRLTHYPMRLNRKTRKVYVIQPRDEVLEANWDDLFFCAQKGSTPALETSAYDVRAHVLADDGETVLHTFTLAYAEMGDKEGLLRLWEFIRRYMEAPDGAQKTYEETSLFMPVDGRRENAIQSIQRAFGAFAQWPALQLLLSPLIALVTVGRCLSMYTCKVPVWPESVENACQVEPNDPYQRNWKQNPKLTFRDKYWPLICFPVGVAVVVYVARWLVSLA